MHPHPDPGKIAGCLVGLAVGDALGAPLEFLPRDAVRHRYPSGLREMTASSHWEKGEYTDDTQMALLLAASLLENRKLVATDAAQKFKRWAVQAKDVGIQTRAVLGMPGYEEDPESCAREYFIDHLHSSAGNGAVMRCAPVALFHLSSMPLLESDSRLSARLTHWDAQAQNSCVILNRSIAAAIQNGTRDVRHAVLAAFSVSQREPWSRLENIETLPEEQIRSGGYTVHTVEAAFWSYLTTTSFEEAVIRAANLGDDADTVAAVTGALAGAYYGYEQIPQRWRDSLMDECRIRTVALALAESPR